MNTQEGTGDTENDTGFSGIHIKKPFDNLHTLVDKGYSYVQNKHRNNMHPFYSLPCMLNHLRNHEKK